MSPWMVVVLAWSAFAAAAPLSGEAHLSAAPLLAAAPSEPTVLSVLPHAAAAIALVVAGRTALRAVPFAPLLLGLAGAEALRFLSADVRASVLTVAFGVLGTAAMMATLAVAPRNVSRRSALRDTAIAGATLALSGLPGASPIACALVARAWSGRRIPAAAAALWAAPFEARAALAAASFDGIETNGASLFLVGLAVLAGALLGARLLRLGPERVARIAIPYSTILGIALLAYAWSLR